MKTTFQGRAVGVAMMVWTFWAGNPSLAQDILEEALANRQRTGNYFSAQHPEWPPLPLNPFPELPVYALGDHEFIYDDREVDYGQFRAAAPTQMALMEMAAANYGCGLWLALSPPTNGAVLLTLHNTLPGTNYQIWSKTDVAATTWTLETNVVGASGQEWTELLVPQSGRPHLFLSASDERTYSLDVSFAGLGEADTGLGVADTMGAVGPDHFVELLNGYVAVFDKSTGQRLQEMDSTNLFAIAKDGTTYPTGSAMIDPRILYDHQSQRWVACALDAFGSKQVILAVTTNDSPSGLTNWTRYLVPVTLGEGDSDYVTLGLDANGLYLTVLHRHSSANAGHTVVALKKPEIYQGTNLQTRWEVDTNATDLKVWTIQPAVNFDSVSSNDYAWLVAKGPPQLGTNYQGGAVLYRRLRWVGTNAILVDTNWHPVSQAAAVNYQDYYDIEGTNLVTLPQEPTVQAPQKDGPWRIDLTFTGCRLMNAVIRNGFLYACQHIGLNGTNGTYVGNETGTNVDRTGIQWLKLRVEQGAALSYSQHGRIFDAAPTSAAYYYFPSMAVNCASDILLGFSGSSSNEYVGAFWTWRSAEGATAQLPTLFQGGMGHFPQDRWGDYSFTSLEPTDSLTFWTVQEYATLQGLWATRVARIHANPSQ
jgi:hypothetical protein